MVIVLLSRIHDIGTIVISSKKSIMIDIRFAGVSISIEVKILLTRIECFRVVAKPCRKPYLEAQHCGRTCPETATTWIARPVPKGCLL
jgi:hypothetical protein